MRFRNQLLQKSKFGNCSIRAVNAKTGEKSQKQRFN